jgi:hypothetical protein
MLAYLSRQRDITTVKRVGIKMAEAEDKGYKRR